MSRVREIYYSFCAFSVFRGVLRHPLMQKFVAYNRITSSCDEPLKLDAYGEFVGEIYRLGGNLTAAVRKLVFEDENIYVTLCAHGRKIDKYLSATVDAELLALAEFSSLTVDDFRDDLEYSGPRSTSSRLWSV